MIHTKQRTALVVAASALSLVFATSAFAQTTVNATAGTAPSAVRGGGWGKGGRPGTMGTMMPGVAGKVTAINGTSITVSGRALGGTRPQGTTATPPTPGTRPTLPAPVTYMIDASSATVTKGTTASSVSAIVVGDEIFAEGTVNGTSVTATSIRDGVMMGAGMGKGKGGVGSGIQGNGQPVVAGSVTSVNGSTFVLTNSGNATYTVDASNATVRKGNATSTVGTLATGDQVIVQGTVNGTSVSATSVFDQGVKPAQGTNGSTGAPAPRGGFMGSIGTFFKKLFGF